MKLSRSNEFFLPVLLEKLLFFFGISFFHKQTNDSFQKYIKRTFNLNNFSSTLIGSLLEMHTLWTGFAPISITICIWQMREKMELLFIQKTQKVPIWSVICVNFFFSFPQKLVTFTEKNYLYCEACCHQLFFIQQCAYCF